MKRNHSSLLFLLVGTMPMSATLLFFVPTVAAQTIAPSPTPSPQVDTSIPAISTPTPSTALPVPQTAIASPAPATLASPQMLYPVAPAVYPTPVYSTAPVANPGGFSVQVTTQIGIPSGVGYPGVSAPTPIAYPQIAYPQTAYPQTAYPQVAYPAPNVYPVTPSQGSYGAPSYSGAYSSIGIPSLPAGNSGAEAIANPALLPFAAQTLWQQIVSAPAGANAGAVAALQQMVREYPNFTPAYGQLAQALIARNRTQEAIDILERGTTLYPNQPELARSLIVTLGNANRWNEASMAARQFAIRNPNSSLASEFTRLADESYKLAQSSSTARPARGSLLGNLLTSGLGYLLTGRAGSSTAVQTPWTPPLANGSSLGSQMTQDLLSKVQQINDPDVTNYVNDIGRRLAGAAGRSDFQFYVVNDRDSGAIALPDGKIFVSAGTIANVNSEAELATIIARQMGHSLLSHPNTIARRGNVTSTIARLLPAVGGLVSPKVNSFNNSAVGTLVSGLMGNLANGLLKPNYTSQMVKDADRAGAKLLESAGYSQTSLINISTGGDRHSSIKAKVQQLLGTGRSWWSLGQ